MCGILGWVTPSAIVPDTGKLEVVQAALQTLRSRGPDAQVAHALPGALMGHARLSILDLREVANQPMPDPTGRFWLVFNGEIFNYRELKSRLEASGHSFTTTGDSEVLLRHLIVHGHAGLADLNGFFALALYDTQTQSLLLARDRYGIKPLVYTHDENGVRFASEAKALLAMGHQTRFAREHLALYFQLNFLPPGASFLEGVQEVLPGTFLKVQTGRPEVSQPYYQLPTPASTAEVPSYETAQGQLVDLLRDSVSLRMISDVPLGVFLSGGIDSSVIATLAAEQTDHLHTFSIGFEEKIWDETHYAELVAKRIGSTHTVFRLSAEDLYAHLDGVLDYLSEPFADASALNVYILSKETRKHVTVALSGDGADELLGGYSRHVGEGVARKFAALSPLASLAGPLLGLLPDGRNSRLGRKVYQLRRLLRALKPAGPRYQVLTEVLGVPGLRKLLRQPDLRTLSETWAPLMAERTSLPDMNGFLRADILWVLPGDMLTKVDRMSMAHSLEVRPPFLDYRVVDFASRLPAHYKLQGHARKRILQDAFRGLLPDELYNRPKQGFEVPLTRWFQTAMRHRIETEFLSRAYIEEQGLFHYAYLKRLWEQILADRGGKADMTLWAFIVFQHWYRRHIG